MYRSALALFTAVVMSASHSQAFASLLGFQISGQFAPCGLATLPPPCGAYGGTFVIDTSAVAGSEDPGKSADYPLHSASVTLNQPTTVISGGPSVAIYNDFNDGSNVYDFLFFYVAGAGGEFKIYLNSPASTVSDYLLTEANVMALINSATSTQAYVKYSASGGVGAQEDAQSFSIERVVIPEPSSLLLTAFGLAGLAAFRRRKKA